MTDIRNCKLREDYGWYTNFDKGISNESSWLWMGKTAPSEKDLALKEAVMKYGVIVLFRGIPE